jgi:hypothetical protein
VLFTKLLRIRRLGKWCAIGSGTRASVPAQARGVKRLSWPQRRPSRSRVLHGVWRASQRRPAPNVTPSRERQVWRLHPSQMHSTQKRESVLLRGTLSSQEVATDLQATHPLSELVRGGSGSSQRNQPSRLRHCQTSACVSSRSRSRSSTRSIRGKSRTTPKWRDGLACHVRGWRLLWHSAGRAGRVRGLANENVKHNRGDREVGGLRRADHRSVGSSSGRSPPSRGR